MKKKSGLIVPPLAVVDDLTEEQQEIVTAYNTPGELRVTRLESDEGDAAQPANAYCRQDGVRFEQQALWGNVLYTYWQRVNICGNPRVNIDSVEIIDSGERQLPPHGPIMARRILRPLTLLEITGSLEHLKNSSKAQEFPRGQKRHV